MSSSPSASGSSYSGDASVTALDSLLVSWSSHSSLQRKIPAYVNKAREDLVKLKNVKSSEANDKAIATLLKRVRQLDKKLQPPCNLIDAFLKMLQKSKEDFTHFSSVVDAAIHEDQLFHSRQTSSQAKTSQGDKHIAVQVNDIPHPMGQAFWRKAFGDNKRALWPEFLAAYQRSHSRAKPIADLAFYFVDSQSQDAASAEVYVTVASFIQRIRDGGNRFPFDITLEEAKRTSSVAVRSAAAAQGAGDNNKMLTLQYLVGNDMKRAIDSNSVELLRKAGTSSEGTVAAKQADLKHDTPLHYAAFLGRLPLVRVLVEELQWSPEVRDTSEMTPLEVAAREDHLEVVKYLAERTKRKVDFCAVARAETSKSFDFLLQRLPEPERKKALSEQTKGRCPIHVAAAFNKDETLKTILHHGADINATEEKSGKTAVHLAAEADNVVAIAELAKAGADLDAEDDSGQTPLMRAVVLSTADTVTALLRGDGAGNCADVTYESAGVGNTVIHSLLGRESVDPGFIPTLVSKLNSEERKELLDHVNNAGVPALIAAACKPASRAAARVEVLERLLDAGADPTVQDGAGNTVGIVAAMEDNLPALRTLVARQVPIDAAQNERGESAIHHVKSVEALQILQEAGVSLNQADAEGRTPLHAIAERGNAELVRAAVEAKAAIDALTTQDKQSVLHAAVRSGNVEVIDSLITLARQFQFIPGSSIPNVSAFVNHSEARMGATALHVASFAGQDKMIENLVSNGADIRKTDQQGNQALHYAAGANQTRALKKLTEIDSSPAHINAPNRDGDSALLVAARTDGGNAVNELLAADADITLRNHSKESALTIARSNHSSTVSEVLTDTMLTRAGAHEGELKIGLSWSDWNDLDLHVLTPSCEHIYFAHRKSQCGGELDVDQNAGLPTNSECVEHVFWERNTPHGEFHVFVRFFRNHNDSLTPAQRSIVECHDPCEFHVRIEAGGDTLCNIQGEVKDGENGELWIPEGASGFHEPRSVHVCSFRWSVAGPADILRSLKCGRAMTVEQASAGRSDAAGSALSSLSNWRFGNNVQSMTTISTPAGQDGLRSIQEFLQSVDATAEDSDDEYLAPVADGPVSSSHGATFNATSSSSSSSSSSCTTTTSINSVPTRVRDRSAISRVPSAPIAPAPPSRSTLSTSSSSGSSRDHSVISRSAGGPEGSASTLSRVPPDSSLHLGSESKKGPVRPTALVKDPAKFSAVEQLFAARAAKATK